MSLLGHKRHHVPLGVALRKLAGEDDVFRKPVLQVKDSSSSQMLVDES